MADKMVKGIKIEIGGEVTGFQKALKKVNAEANKTQKELAEVNRLLKLDPKNTELLAQKQELLAKATEETKIKLEALKKAKEQADVDMKNGTEINQNQYRKLQREIAATENEIKMLEKSTKQSFESAGKSISDLGNKTTDIGKKVSGLSVAVAGAGVAAVLTGNEYEAQMSRVKAISEATNTEFKELNDLALKLGADTSFSAKEAAEGMENLASAGFNTKEIISAMPGMLDLAASSGEDLANSSEIAATTLRGFNLDASQAGHVADVLAKNAANTNAAIADTGLAMKYIAPVAKNAGWSLESVTAAIGEMADAGIKGEQAGTTLRGALTNLMNPSKEQKSAMKELGFSAYDSAGKMKPLSQIIGELRDKTKNLTSQKRDDAIATIMGTNALSGMQVLLDNGSVKLDKMTESLKNCDGASKKMSETMLDNTKGSFEQAMGSLETAAIKVQTILAPTINKIANIITNLANSFSALSPTSQKVILVIAGIVAALGPVLIFIGKVISAVGAIVPIVMPILSVIGTAISAVVAAIGWIPIAIVAVIAIITTLWFKCDAFRNFILGIFKILKDTFKSLIQWIVTTCNNIFEKIVELIKSARSILKNIGQWIYDNVITPVINFITPIINVVWTIANAIYAIISKILEIIFTLLKVGIIWVYDNIITPIISFFAFLAENVVACFIYLWNGIVNIFLTCAEWFSVNVITPIAKVFSDVSERITSSLRQAWSDIKQVFSTVGEFFGGIWDTIKEKFTTIGSKIGDSMGGAFKTVVNSVIGFAEKTINGFIKAINGAINLINDIPGVDIKPLNLINIPQLANGGILTNGQAIVAEAGPELISLVNGKAVVQPLTGTSKNTAVTATTQSNSPNIIFSNQSLSAQQVVQLIRHEMGAI